MRLGRLLLPLLLVAASCAPQAPEPPLPEETLVALLADLHLAESIVEEADYHARDSLTVNYYERIARQYDLERAQLDTVLQFIRDQPLLMERLYQQVYEDISVRDAERQGIKMEE